MVKHGKATEATEATKPQSQALKKKIALRRFLNTVKIKCGPKNL
jgi:thymidine phosphorylase